MAAAGKIVTHSKGC